MPRPPFVPPDEDGPFRADSLASPALVPGTGSVGLPFVVLPQGFQSEGLTLLRATDYRGAERYYLDLTRRDPEAPEGWYGLGASRQGMGRIGPAVAAYMRALALDREGFPLPALVIEARPGRPEIHHRVAMALAGYKSARATRIAIAILDEVVASPMTPRGLVDKAEAALRRLRRDLEWIDAQGDPELLGIMKAAARENRRHLVTRGFLLIVLLGLVGAGIFLARQHSRSAALHDQGLESYMAASRAARRATGTGQARTEGRDAFVLYQEALARFTEAAKVLPGSFQAHYMAARAAEGALEQVPAHFGARSAPPDLVASLKRQALQADAASKKLDPGGKEAARLKRYLQEAANRTL